MAKVIRRGILNWNIGEEKVVELRNDENIYDSWGLGDESFLQGDVLKPTFEVQKGRLAWRAKDERLTMPAETCRFPVFEQVILPNRLSLFLEF